MSFFRLISKSLGRARGSKSGVQDDDEGQERTRTNSRQLRQHKATFRHTPLPVHPDTIRIFTFENGKTGVLSITMKTVSLSELPKYIAVSYVWGDPTPFGTIQINGLGYDIPENLYQALGTFAALREQNYWVDAICINQHDAEEKANQILRMSTIFQRAECVYAYLTNDASLAPERGSNSSNRLSQLAYWKRMWIVPEILAARDISFVYGDSFLSLDETIKLFNWRYDSYRPLLHLRTHRKKRFGVTGRFEYLLWMYHDKECSEARDRIFSLLSVAQDTCLVDDPVDYNCSLYDLWCHTVQRIYKSEPLSGPFNENTDRRFRIVGQAALVQKALNGDLPPAYPGGAGLSEKNRGLIDEAAGRSANPPYSCDLTATGMFVGTVKFVGPTYATCLGSHKAEQAWSVGWRKCASGYNETELEALRRAEHTYANELLSSRDSRFQRIKVLKKTSSFAMEHSGPDELEDGVLPGRPQALAAMPTKQGDTSVEQNFGSDEGARKCFLESSPNVSQFGLVPFNTEPGDRIVAFWNCNRTLVLRPMDGWFAIVGPADVPTTWERNNDHNIESVENYTTGDDHEVSALKKNPVEVYFEMETLRILSA